MTIRFATTADLPNLEELATEFCTASTFIQEFEIDRFIETWTALLAGPGVIFLAEIDGEIVGALGAVRLMEPYNRRYAATEMFWFCAPERRGGGLKLLEAFERWAYKTNCSQVRVCHMMDLAPQKLNRLYERMGYQGAEIHYTKELI